MATVRIDGTNLETEEPPEYFFFTNSHIEDRDYWERHLNELDSAWRKTNRIDYYNDYGVTLIYLGRYKEAEQVFKKIETVIPGLYNTAANLGTTYELLGENQLALEWISKGVQINPASHDSSEWLHVKILEVKIKGLEYNTAQYLLAYNSGNEVVPDSSLGKIKLESLRDAITFQLSERMVFIKPQEPIVALLLFELGNICAITDDIATSLFLYDKAKEYGYESDILNKRYKKFANMQAGADISDGELDRAATTISKAYNVKLILGAIGILIITILVFFLRRRHIRKLRSAKEH